MSVLTDQPDVWSTAVSQTFFSIGVTMVRMHRFHFKTLWCTLMSFLIL